MDALESKKNAQLYNKLLADEMIQEACQKGKFMVSMNAKDSWSVPTLSDQTIKCLQAEGYNVETTVNYTVISWR